MDEIVKLTHFLNASNGSTMLDRCHPESQDFDRRGGGQFLFRLTPLHFTLHFTLKTHFLVGGQIARSEKRARVWGLDSTCYRNKS